MGWQDAPVVGGAPPSNAGSRWTSAPIVEGAKAPGMSEGIAQQFGSGALFNFGDEVTAGVRAAFPKFSNWMMRGPALQRDESIGGNAPAQTVSDNPSFEGRYNDELTVERTKAKAFEKENPTTALASNALGGVASTALALPAGASAAAPTLIGNVVRQGALGAGLGATAGFGGGEGGFENRAMNAVIGGGIGGALGGAMPIVGMGARAAMESAPGRYLTEKVVSPAARSVASIFEGPTAAKSLSAAAPDGSPGVMGPMGQFAERTSNVAQSGAVDRLATAMQRGKISPTSAERRLTGLGDEAMLADVDPQFMSMARMANTKEGATRTHAKTVLESRDSRTGNRIEEAFNGAEPPKSAYALRGEGQEYDRNLQKVGQSAYDEMRGAGLNTTPELEAIQNNPAVAAAIKKVRDSEEASRVGTNRRPASEVELMHMVKREIQSLGLDATGRPSSTAYQWQQTANEFVDALKAANPKLAEADRAYAQTASLPEFFDMGAAAPQRASMTEKGIARSAPALEDKITSATPEQIQAARAGYTNYARSQAREGTNEARALARRLAGSDPQKSIVGTLYEPEHARSILRRAEAEKTFAETSNDILRGSKTADKLMEAIDTGGAAVRIGGSGISGRILEKVDDVINKLAGPNEAVRDEIGRVMLNPNTAENQRILRLAQEILRRRQAGSVGRPASVEGLASALSEK